MGILVFVWDFSLDCFFGGMFLLKKRCDLAPISWM